MSLRKAINQFCRECIFDPLGGSGTWRQQVEACTAHNCPIYSVRPLPIGSSSKRAGGNESSILHYEIDRNASKTE